MHRIGNKTALPPGDPHVPPDALRASGGIVALTSFAALPFGAKRASEQGRFIKPVKLVALVYESLRARNIRKLEEIVAKDVTWNVIEGFPYSGVYTGLNTVLFCPYLGN